MFPRVLVILFLIGPYVMGILNTKFNKAEPTRYDLTRFLKDSQHTAVIMADYESEVTKPIPDRWKTIWNAAPFRYCIDHGADRLYQQRDTDMRPPTKITGKLTRMDPDTKEYFQGKETLMEETSKEDESSTLSALKALMKEDLSTIETVVFLGGFDGRFDRLLANLNTLMLANTMLSVPTVALHTKDVITVLPEGDLALKVDRNKLTGLSGFVPLSQMMTKVTTKGFRWNVEDQEMKFGGMISTSNELDNDLLEFKTTAPLVLSIQIKN